MTLAALTADVRSHLEGDYRPRLEILDSPMDLLTDTVSLSYNGVLAPGAVVSIDTEDCYVLDWDQGSRQAIVIRGHRGTVVAAHADGATVELNPRFSAGQIYRACRDEVRGWSSQLYQVAGAAIDVGAQSAVAEVPAAFAGLFGVIEAVAASHYRGGTSVALAPTSGVLYREVPIMGIIRNSTSLGFTREIIRFGAVAQMAGSVHLTAGLPFGDLVQDTTTTLVSQGIQTYMEEPLTLGAAARLLRPREAARTQRHGQGEPRRGEEVPPMHTRNAGADLGLLAKEAFGRAARRLAISYPLRFT